jgi:hypothetical protein
MPQLYQIPPLLILRVYHARFTKCRGIGFTPPLARSEVQILSPRQKPENVIDPENGNLVKVPP